MTRKYTPTVRKERQLSPGFLEDALEEVTIFFCFPFCLLFCELVVPVQAEFSLSGRNYVLLIDQEDEADYYESRRSADRHRFEEDLEIEARAERRIMNAKKAYHFDLTNKNPPLFPVFLQNLHHNYVYKKCYF